MITAETQRRRESGRYQRLAAPVTSERQPQATMITGETQRRREKPSNEEVPCVHRSSEGRPGIDRRGSRGNGVLPCGRGLRIGREMRTAEAQRYRGKGRYQPLAAPPNSERQPQVSSAPSAGEPDQAKSNCNLALDSVALGFSQRLCVSAVNQYQFLAVHDNSGRQLQATAAPSARQFDKAGSNFNLPLELAVLCFPSRLCVSVVNN